MPESSFRSINIRKKYDSDENDDSYFVLNNFYMPCLSRSVSYSRLSGFFSSSALMVAARGISDFILNGGKMRLVTSPRLSASDIEAIKNNQFSESEVIEKSLIREIFEKNIVSNDGVEALGWMVANGVLEIRIAIMLDENKRVIGSDNIAELGLFHSKIGIMEDKDGNRISFSGSINETFMGWTKNIESFDVFCEWKSEDQREYFQGHVKEFEKYWSLGDNGRCKTVEFPEAVKNLWIKAVPKDLEALAIMKKFNPEKKQIGFSNPEGFVLRDYQKKAVDNWVSQGYNGSFDMATGTGKTSTAMAAALRLYEDKNEKIGIIVTCPYLHLVEMWVDEFSSFGINGVVEAHSQSKDWKVKLGRKISLFNNRQRTFVVVTTINTFSTDYFQEKIREIRGDVLLISDEVHRMGSSSYSKSLPENITYRLGLSATIDRWNDPRGTKKILDYYGDRCIEYSLEEALKQGMLTPYKYYPVPCYYNEEEYDRIIEINKVIDELSKSKRASDLLEIKRQRVNGTRIMAKMEDKLNKLVHILSKYKNKHHMLIYCGATNVVSYESEIEEDTGASAESERMVEYVSKRVNAECDMDLRRFTYDVDLDERKGIIEDFTNKKIQALVAIRCLDEGVNIPNIRTAFILSSGEDPKEYIQRRGRVLRLAKGKKFAEIYDFIALPLSASPQGYLSENEEMDLRLIARELKRVYEFADISDNRDHSIEMIETISTIFKITDMRGYVDECQ